LYRNLGQRCLKKFAVYQHLVFFNTTFNHNLQLLKNQQMLHLLLQFDFVADQADSVYSTLDTGCKSLAAVFGLIGGIRIYNKWQLHGHHHLHVDKEIAG